MWSVSIKGQNIWFEKQERQEAARICKTRYTAGRHKSLLFYAGFLLFPMLIDLFCWRWKVEAIQSLERWEHLIRRLITCTCVHFRNRTCLILRCVKWVVLKCIRWSATSVIRWFDYFCFNSFTLMISVDSLFIHHKY